MRFVRLSFSRAASSALLAACAALATPAAAALLVYEPFDYPSGADLHGLSAGGLNLTGSYVDGPFVDLRLEAASPGLDYGNLAGVPGVAGNRLTQPLGTSSSTATVSVDADVLVNPGDAVYWSVLMTLDDTGNANRLANITFTDDANGDTISFGEPSVGSRAIRVSATTVASGGLVASSADNSFADGDTVLLVGRYFNGAAPGSDLLELLVYDTADAELLPSSFDPLDPNAERSFSIGGIDIDFAAIRSIDFTLRGTGNNFIDELRIGDTYASVVPEPTTAALLLAGLLGLGARGRRRA